MVQYVNPETGLQTGYAEIAIGVNGTVTIEDRVDVGLPGGEPVPLGRRGSGRAASVSGEPTAQSVVTVSARGIETDDGHGLALALVLGGDRVERGHGGRVPDV